MKTLKKVLVTLAMLLIVLILVGAFIINRISHKALPNYNEKIELVGLIDEVTVYRDTHAVPHIYAKNEHDLYLTVGYLMAQDRLWQMDLLRRITQGRLSEIFGKDMVGTDHLLRALRIPEKSAMVLPLTDANIVNALEAFATGVNLFIQANPKKLPPEFTLLGYQPELWEPIHSINLIGYMAWDLSNSWETEVLLHKLAPLLDEQKFKELLPDLHQHKTYVHPANTATESQEQFALLDGNIRLKELNMEIFNGSNNWAVSAQKSKTGKPILANDMHLGLNAPGIWYQMHQVVEGKLNVTGVVLPGQPLVIVGHNERVAWGMTNVSVDEGDFYLEAINPEDPSQYRYKDEWLPIEIRQEKIAIKGGDTITKEIRLTHRGPIISDFKKVKDEAISMQWTGNLYSNELRTVYLLNRAANWEDFRNALTTMTAVSQNVIYADVDGNIGLQTACGAPLRKNGNGISIYPGETDEYDWEGLLPFEELPYTYNPPQGHISSANNRTTGSEYPHYIGYWYSMSNRADRIIELLNAKDLLDIDDFKEMLADWKSKHVERYLPKLIDVLSNVNNRSANQQKALEGLQEWDMVLDRESVAATVFETFYLHFIKNIAMDEMGTELYNEFLGTKLDKELFDMVWRNPQSAWIDNIDTPDQETFEDIVMLSFNDAVEWLQQELGNNIEKWEWGKIHRLTLAHPMGSVKLLDKIFNLNRGPFAVGGSFHTVCPYSYSFKKPFDADHGASQRHIYNLGNWDNSWVIIPTGTSGIPSSKYYCDQSEMYVSNDYKNDLYSKQSIATNATYVARYLPK